MEESIPFLPGESTPVPGPLGRFLPPFQNGVVRRWLQERYPPGSWVLDPFGVSPKTVVEAAQAGYRVLVAANNPVSRALVEVWANPPSTSELQAALADLGAASKGGERIEKHIKDLYATPCDQCGQEVSAEYFLWEKQVPAPYARYYHCKNCNDSGERPATPKDIERSSSFSASGLHRARALERVVPINDPDRRHAEEALEVYLPRAVYALFNLINKIDGMSLTPHRRALLQILLLHACDQGNTLWAHPTERSRPKQLITPSRFRENNVWFALENGILLWSGAGNPVPLVSWPEHPPAEGGISLYEGRLKDVAPSLGDLSITAITANIPRPNQAFWTLSALWAGWLWGREAVGPFKSVLRRHRYDWAWHTAALTSALGSLAEHVREGTPFFGLIGEVEPGFLTSSMIAASSAGFVLDGIALRQDSGYAQVSWHKGSKAPSLRAESAAALRSSIRGARNLLQNTGQPCEYLTLHAAALAAMAEDNALQLVSTGERTSLPQEGTEPTPAQNFQRVHSVLKDTFMYRSGFLRIDGKEQLSESGYWWLRDVDDNLYIQRSAPLFDRIEIEVVRLLLKNPDCNLNESDEAVCRSFPGLLTPEKSLVTACLDSYGDQSLPGSGRWMLREQDDPKARRRDIGMAREILQTLGERLGYQVETKSKGGEAARPGSTPTFWRSSGEVEYVFYILASAAISEPVFASEFLAIKHALIILPGSRSSLVDYKLRNDPMLRQEVLKRWKFIKYRHLRQLAGSPVLTRENFLEQVDLDPVTYTAPQMRML